MRLNSIPRALTPVVMMMLLVLMLPAHGLLALEVPALKGRVNDLAEMINPGTRSQLESALAQLEQSDATQVVVLTVPSLEGDSLEAFSMRVVEQWQIGQKKVDNGVLLLIAKNDRKIRIEVGYGLEGKLTDLTAGRIIRNVITPQFKMGRFDQGIIAGVSAIVGTVRGEYKAPANARSGRRSSRGVSSPGTVGLIFLLLFVNLLGRANRVVGAAGGAVLAPVFGGIFFGLGLTAMLVLVPVGLIGGFLLSLMGGPLSFGHMTGYRRGGTHLGGGFGGGFGGGGFGGGGFGGFSGGGGGFGGGGASGGW